MSLPGTFALAVSLSMDSFAASLTRGASSRHHRVLHVVGAGALFAASEVASLSAGWGIGYAALGMISAIDHWVAFALLVAIGGRLIHEGWVLPAEGRHPAARNSAASRALRLVGTALATSIDAGAVGVSMAFIGYDFVTSAAVLGGVTFAMAVAGSMIGRRAGPLLGRRAEIAGGVLLIAVGCKTLIEHLYG
jgi:putative Mn2+ efflux pump MntP